MFVNLNDLKTKESSKKRVFCHLFLLKPQVLGKFNTMQIGSVVVAPLWRSQCELLPFDRRKQSSGPRNPVLIYKLYSDMHPSDFSSKHLFNLAIRTNDTASRWFLRQQLGVNKLGQMLKAMAKDSGFLKHKRITNHSVRKFLVQKFRNTNIHPLKPWQ